MAGAFLRVFAALLLAGAAALPRASAECDTAKARSVQPNAADMHEAEVLYLPTPHAVVAAMLRLAGVTRTDVVYDLGSGDGRIPIAAARDHGARGVGIELDGRMIAQARCNAGAAGMEHMIEFRQEDMFRTDLRDATVVTLFLFPELNLRLMPKLLAELQPGARIVSHRFGIGDWPPDRVIESSGHQILLWTVPPAGAAKIAPR